ncbi:large conductance mechanosensitive channel protein MscL [Schaalia suimastitidis]|uniref:large conductance mechanosensitive channel protein MscL n=1 Tax=Schaalia suimastitidis TaxID=121163 RepID=UPI0004061970|nr:large conductance mechanosensitive channel protein MscL [Schaalia suimastitidis]
MLKGFKEFIMRGNVLDLAVAVIIAGAFSPIVDAITKVILNLIGAVVGKPSFDNVFEFTVNGTVIQPGTILTAAVNFLLIAAAVYFAIVVPMNKLSKKKEEPAEEPAEPSEETKLLTEIRDLLAKN